MNNKDEKLIAGYMGWQEDELLVGYCTAPDRTAHFDLNDAGLCVKEMQKRGEWRNFLIISRNIHRLEFDSQVIAWLFNADNFFASMAAWLKEEKK